LLFSRAMNTNLTHTPPARAGARAAALAGLALLAGCVTKNLTTGEVVPRGEQRYPFERVERDVANVRVGMNKGQVLLILGSPAEKDEAGDVWIYLPERYGVILPARALRLEFKDGLLAEHEFRPIVLGARL